MRSAHLWSLPPILQVSRSRTPSFPPPSLACGQELLSEMPAPGNRSFFPESEGGDGLFIFFRGTSGMHSCLCGRLPIIKEEWITCYAQTLYLQRSATLMKQTLAAPLLPPFYFLIFFSLKILELDWNWKSWCYMHYVMLKPHFCFRVMEVSGVFPNVCGTWGAISWPTTLTYPE